MKLLFLLLIIAESAAASLLYFPAGDYRRGVYWLCTGIIILVVTF